MRIFGVDRCGGPEVQRFHDVTPPPADPGTVRIRVLAAGVNPADVKVRACMWPRATAGRTASARRPAQADRMRRSTRSSTAWASRPSPERSRW